MKLMLIDGLSIINRAFYALPVLSTKSGEYTNAVLGFLNIFMKMYEEESPDYAAVAFDLPKPTFRHERYGEYKATRKSMPDELRPQISLLRQVLEAMGIKQAAVEGFEADDVLGTLARQAEAAGYEVVLISGDRDLLQIATERIKIRIPKTSRGHTVTEDYFAADVLEKVGVSPTEYIDVKALMGDSSDNIPGVAGIGEKTATKIIQDYKNIETAIANAADIKPKRAAENLEAHADLARLSKELATIRTDVPIDVDIGDYAIGDMFNTAALAEFQRLELRSLIKKYGGKTASSSLAGGNDNRPEITGQLIKDAGKLPPAPKDTAYSLAYENGKIAGAGFIFDDSEPVFVPAGLDGFVDVIRSIFEGNCRKIGFNIKRDIHELRKIGVRMENPAFDAMLAGHVLNSLRDGAGIEDLAHEYLGGAIFSQKPAQAAQLSLDDMIGGQNNDNHDKDLAQAAFEHVTIISRAYPIMHKALHDQEQEELYYNIELPLLSVLADMEGIGIKVDADFLRTYGNKLQIEIDRLLAINHKLAGQEFNPNSPKQVGKVLFEDMGLPGGRKTKTGYSTTADVLERLAANHEIAAKILEYRSHTKLKSTYVDGLLAQIDKKSGRIHTTFHQIAASTGRLSSSEPNLQNIPIRTALGRELRRAFIPADGYVFVDADYSQIELRVLAELSQDPTFLQAFRDNQDVHRITAAQVFHIAPEQVTNEMRSYAKAVNFGIVYGISAFGLADDIKVSVKEAQDYINGYFARYPKVKEYLDKSVADTKERGYAETLFGRRRAFTGITSSNFNQRANSERAAMNMPVQGSAADIIKIAMAKVHRRLANEGLKSRLILQVHDELLLEAVPAEIDSVKQILQEEMAQAVQLDVPLVIDIATGESWYESK